MERNEEEGGREELEENTGIELRGRGRGGHDYKCYFMDSMKGRN